MRPTDRWDSLIRYHAERHQLDWRLMKAQMLAESAADPTAVSPVGARGLAQFMPTTWWEWWDERAGIAGPPPTVTPHDPDRALGAMAAYLRSLYLYFRPLTGLPPQLHHIVLAAYNWGMGRVRRHLAVNSGELVVEALPTETQHYLARIDRLYGEGPA